MDITIRKATVSDAELVISFLKKLADYENLSEFCNIEKEALSKLMTEENGLNVLFAEIDSVPIGFMAYYFYKVATFSGKHVMYIEDVYVDEKYRRYGIGNKLFSEAKCIAKERNCARLEWKCLDWNTLAINFYDKIGGIKSSDEWITYTISSDNF